MARQLSIAVLNEKQELLSVGKQCFTKLPTIAPIKGRVGFRLAHAVRELLGSDVFFLEPLRSERGSVPIVRLQPSSPFAAAGYRWVAPQEIKCGEMPEPDVLARCSRYSEAVGDYAWYTMLFEWLTKRVERLGHSVQRIEQWNSTSGNVLVKVRTTGPQLWFKAVSDANWRDFSLAQFLSESQSLPVARVLAVEPAWKGMLLEHVEGVELLAIETPRGRDEAMRMLAQLQIKGTGAREPLLERGAMDLRAKTMSRLLPDIRQEFEVALRQSEYLCPEGLSLKELFAALEQMCGDVDDFTFSEGLIPLNLSPHHMLLTRHGVVLLDWAQACVSLPMLAGKRLWSNASQQSQELAHRGVEHRYPYYGCWGSASEYMSSSLMEGYLEAFDRLVAVMIYRMSQGEEGSEERNKQLFIFARNLHYSTRFPNFGRGLLDSHRIRF